jgi:hypothetical protein
MNEILRRAAILGRPVKPGDDSYAGAAMRRPDIIAPFTFQPRLMCNNSP